MIQCMLKKIVAGQINILFLSKSSFQHTLAAYFYAVCFCVVFFPAAPRPAALCGERWHVLTPGSDWHLQRQTQLFPHRDPHHVCQTHQARLWGELIKEEEEHFLCEYSHHTQLFLLCSSHELPETPKLLFCVCLCSVVRPKDLCASCARKETSCSLLTVTHRCATSALLSFTGLIPPYVQNEK